MAKKSSLADAQRPIGMNRPSSMEDLIRAVQQDAPLTPEATRTLPVESLKRSRFQPRRSVKEGVKDRELAELAESIRTIGIIEPIAVRPYPGDDNHYEILAGDRRWRAAQLAGLNEVPVIVHAVDDVTAAAIALVENLQRQNLNAIDEATAIQRLVNEFGLSQIQIAQLLSKSKSVVSRTLGLLTLPHEVQNWLVEGKLDAGHARVLINLPKKDQVNVAKHVINSGWSVRDLENWKSKASESKSKQARTLSKTTRDPNYERLECSIGEWLASPVKLRVRKNGGGSLTIRFTSTEECNGILERIGFPLDDAE